MYQASNVYFICAFAAIGMSPLVNTFEPRYGSKLTLERRRAVRFRHQLHERRPRHPGLQELLWQPRVVPPGRHHGVDACGISCWRPVLVVPSRQVLAKGRSANLMRALDHWLRHPMRVAKHWHVVCRSCYCRLVRRYCQLHRACVPG